jgi:hypothetical protein
MERKATRLPSADTLGSKLTPFACSAADVTLTSSVVAASAVGAVAASNRAAAATIPD